MSWPNWFLSRHPKRSGCTSATIISIASSSTATRTATLKSCRNLHASTEMGEMERKGAEGGRKTIRTQASISSFNGARQQLGVIRRACRRERNVKRGDERRRKAWQGGIALVAARGPLRPRAAHAPSGRRVDVPWWIMRPSLPLQYSFQSLSRSFVSTFLPGCTPKVLA